jgi:hypothetical protein
MGASFDALLVRWGATFRGRAALHSLSFRDTHTHTHHGHQSLLNSVAAQS